jgi:stage II sporulation protein M
MKISEIKKYIKSLRYYILFSSFIFLFAVFSGYSFAQNFPEETQKIIEELKEFFSVSEDETSLQMFLFIFENNVIKLFTVIFLGVFAGLIPLLSVWGNGMILGIFAQIISQELSWSFFILGILPHGIIEIPVLILSTAIGIRIGKIAVWRLFGRNKNFTKEFTKAIKFYILVLVPLLFIAALIEAFITPIILEIL